ncbi:hypothetical protein XCR_3368 [Xanthomonas campestris pv. raphani 756C]|nr:hypothetical protein XCR_3368 [Xanthomonas campestris pv. raphani 756C]
MPGIETLRWSAGAPAPILRALSRRQRHVEPTAVPVHDRRKRSDCGVQTQSGGQSGGVPDRGVAI